MRKSKENILFESYLDGVFHHSEILFNRTVYVKKTEEYISWGNSRKRITRHFDGTAFVRENVESVQPIDMTALLSQAVAEGRDINVVMLGDTE